MGITRPVLHFSGRIETLPPLHKRNLKPLPDSGDRDHSALITIQRPIAHDGESCHILAVNDQAGDYSGESPWFLRWIKKFYDHDRW